jgi:hypothetical protein
LLSLIEGEICLIMEDSIDLTLIKSRWNEVLDHLESENRVAWIAYFDARLVSFTDRTLRLSFIDAEKFGGAHDFAHVRKPGLREALERSISQIFGEEIAIIAE